MTAYLVELTWEPRITEFTYEKETEKQFRGCKIVGPLLGRRGYFSKIQNKDNCLRDPREALEKMAHMLRERMESEQRKVNETNSAIGQVERLLRSLPDQPEAKQAMNPGDRVKLSAEGLECLASRFLTPISRGTVRIVYPSGGGPDGKEALVSVCWDGRRTTNIYAASFIEVIPPEAKHG